MLEEIKQVAATAEVLCTQQQVETALDRMAADINQQLSDSNPLVLCVMNGGVVASGQLLTRLTMPLNIDAINASRYQNKTVGETLDWLLKPSTPLKDRIILIIDDILDEGITLVAIHRYCLQQGAKAVYIAVLVNKILDRDKPIQADFVGLHVENRYVFGYGMDHKGYLRNAAGIYAVAGS